MFRINLKNTFLLGILLLVCVACQDRNEVENKAYVIAVGMEKSKKDHLLKVSYLISNPEYGSLQQGGGENAPPKEIITVDAPDVISTKDTLNTMIPKDLTFEQLSHIMISEELARNDKIVSWMYDSAKDTEIRRDISLFITKETPEEYFEKLNPKFEVRPHKFLHLMTEQGKHTGFVPPNSQLLQYYRILEAKGDLFLAAYTTTDVHHEDNLEEPDRFLAGELGVSGESSTTQFVGSAVFKDGVMIGKLNGEETRLAILLNNTLPSYSYFMVATDPFDKSLNMTIKVEGHQGNKTTMDIHKETPTINVNVPLTVSVLTNHSMADYSSTNNRDKLEKHIEKRMNKKFAKLIKKTQKEFKGQPFGWSLIARKEFRTLQEYKKFDFKRNYPRMDIKVTTDVKINEFGRQKTIPKLEEVTER